MNTEKTKLHTGKQLIRRGIVYSSPSLFFEVFSEGSIHTYDMKRETKSSDVEQNTQPCGIGVYWDTLLWVSVDFEFYE